MPQISMQDLIEVESIEEYVDEVIAVGTSEDGGTGEGEPEILSEEEREEIVELLTKERSRLDSALEKLGADLEAKFSKFSNRRHDKENEWMGALLQNDGRWYYYNYDKKNWVFEQKTTDKPSVNITRRTCNAAINRMQDIQFPLGGDFNFAIHPHLDERVQSQVGSQKPAQPPQSMGQGTPQGMMENVPTAPQGQPQQGQAPMAQMSQGQAARQIIDSEWEKARLMEQEIKDQFVKARFGNKAREAMRDWVLLGTAVMKGPVVDVNKAKQYEMLPTSDGSYEADLRQTAEKFPNLHRVDPKYFYPDPDALIPEDVCEAFEFHPMSRSKLIRLKNNSAFMRRKLKEVLETDPEGTDGIGMLSELTLLDSDPKLQNRYQVKEYHGPLEKEMLQDLDLISEEDADDKLKEFYGEVWFCNGVVFRVSLNIVEGYDSIPYYMVPWEKDDGSVFGHGMAWMMKDAQRVAKSGWQMLLDNSGLSAGPQMVVNREMIEPADGRWEIKPMKVWHMTEYGQDVNEAFQFYSVPNNQEQIASTIEMAMQFGDLESESPLIQSNMTPQANNTASGQAMELTISNVTQRGKSQLWDDYVTRPVVSAVYHYNMQYSDKPEIKGNFDIQLAGATEAIDSQIRAQELERILALASSNEEFMLQVEPNKAFRQIAEATRVGNSILRTPQEVQEELQRRQQEQENQPPDPETIRAQTAMMREETRKQELQMTAQEQQAEHERESRQMELDHQSEMAEMELRQFELQSQLVQKETEKEIKLLELAMKANMSLEEIKAKLAIADAENQTKQLLEESKNQRFLAEAQIKREEGTGI